MWVRGLPVPRGRWGGAQLWKKASRPGYLLLIPQGLSWGAVGSFRMGKSRVSPVPLAKDKQPDRWKPGSSGYGNPRSGWWGQAARRRIAAAHQRCPAVLTAKTQSRFTLALGYPSRTFQNPGLVLTEPNRASSPSGHLARKKSLPTKDTVAHIYPGNLFINCVIWNSQFQPKGVFLLSGWFLFLPQDSGAGPPVTSSC